MCRPFYLARDLTVVVTIAAYISPNANAGVALLLLHDVNTKQMQDYSKEAFVFAGDFNKACLKSVLP